MSLALPRAADGSMDTYTIGVRLAWALGAVLLPFVFGPILASQILAFAVFALGYNLLLGYGGELSFGHAAYFGIGAYGTVMTAQIVPNIPIAVASGVAFATLGGALFGAFSLRRRGIYFSMITLAFAQMLYYIFLQATGLTGGSNGLILPDLRLGPLVPGDIGFLFYIVLLGLVGVVYLIVRRIVRSPFGRILIAIRENEQRARSLGYDVNRFLFLAFVMSGFFSGLGGAMYALVFSFVTPELFFWSTSGNIVMISIIGGVGTLSGPLIGSAIYIILQNYLTEIFNVWEIFFGLIIIVVVLLAPRGIIGLYKQQRGETDGFDVHDLFERLRRQS